MVSGHATADSTARYASRFTDAMAHQFFRRSGELTVSSLGAGTYLGGMDEETGSNYVEAVRTALQSGINFIDTSLNYRNQLSERNVGKALRELMEAGEIERTEFVVCTKAGYLVPDAVPKGELRKEDIVGGMHSVAPSFLKDQLERSRQNLGLETIDVFYLHNPETQLNYLPADEVYARFEEAFRALEAFVAQGRIRYYGAATWQGFREKPASPHALSLTHLMRLAEEAGGGQHHFRYIQLPYNLAMVEGFVAKSEHFDSQQATVLEVAAHSGISVIASATLLQAKLSRNLPDEIARLLSGPQTDAQRAIQFTRSTPGITVALVGMSKKAHVKENLGVAAFPPASGEEYMRLFS